MFMIGVYNNKKLFCAFYIIMSELLKFIKYFVQEVWTFSNIFFNKSNYNIIR